MTTRDTFAGPTLFSYGFRPFFLSATLFALFVIPAWWLVWRGDVGPVSHFAPVDWHVHEMVFGYGAAVVAGFLFTAVPNWTGRMPTRGWPLVLLLALWVSGRVASAGIFGFGPVAVALIDQAFLLAVVAMIAREIVAGKNWRNFKVLVPVTLLWLSNIVFHAEAALLGSADTARRLGIALLIFLIMLIGGRIIPSFTRNWLARSEGARLPVPFNRFDAVAVAIGVAALLSWVLAPLSLVCAAFCAIAGLVHLLRLLRWQGAGTWHSPLLLVLHVAYLMVPIGFLGLAAGSLGLVSPALGAHVLGIGAVGGMTMAVMTRATLGHTGRPLESDSALTGAFVLLLGAMVVRIAGSQPIIAGADGTSIAVLLWTASFALLAWRLGPWLACPKVSRRAPSGRPAPRRRMP